MRKKRLFRLVLIFAGFFVYVPSFACGSDEYEVCTGLCYCVPNGNKVVNTGGAVVVAPYVAAGKVVNGVLEGDADKVMEGIGAAVLASSCYGCVAVQQQMAAGDRAFLDRMVAHGFLTFLTTGEPIYTVLEVASAAPKQYKLTHPPPPPNGVPSTIAPPRKKRRLNVETVSTCAMQNPTTGLISIGWTSDPRMVDPEKKQTLVYPKVELREGDEIAFKVDGKCALPPETKQIKGGVLVFSYSTTILTESDDEARVWLVGSAATLE